MTAFGLRPFAKAAWEASFFAYHLIRSEADRFYIEVVFLLTFIIQLTLLRLDGRLDKPTMQLASSCAPNPHR